MVNLLRSTFWVLLNFLKGILSVLDGKGIYKMSEPCCAPVAALFIGVMHVCAVVIALQSSVEKLLLVQQTQVPCNRSKTLIADLAVVCSLSR